MKKNIISAVLILLISVPVNAAVSESAGIIFPVLEIGAGARALAMGGAFVSVADDVSAVFWNPAGLASLKSAQIGIAYDKWFMDTFYSQTLFSIPMGPGSLGAEVVYVNLGSLDGLDSTGGLTGVSINPYNIGGCVSYGFSLNTDLAIGASLKFISQSTGTLSAAGYAADIGLLYRTKLFSAGIDLQNAGAGSGYSLPMNVRAGASFRVLNGPQHSLLAAMDLQYMFKASPEVSIGVEYVYGGFTAIRAGYNLSFAGSTIEGLSGLSAGAGIILSGFKLDYAAVPYGELGLTHRVTLTYEFEQAKKKEGAKAAQNTANGKIEEAEVLEKEGKFKLAAQKMREAVMEDQSNADLWRKLGMLYYNDKNKDAAVSSFERYLKLKPADTKFRDWLEKYRK